jgi:hypothetical protein
VVSAPGRATATGGSSARADDLAPPSDFQDGSLAALLQRIDNLLVNPSAVWLVDHYLDRNLARFCP